MVAKQEIRVTLRNKSAPEILIFLPCSVFSDGSHFLLYNRCRCLAILVTAILGCAAFGCSHIGNGKTAPIPHSAVAPSSGALFVDVAEQAGIHYKWTIPGGRPLNILQAVGNGCAFLDYDNDGNLDVLLVGYQVALYKGDGHGHFRDVSHETGVDKLSGHFLGCAVGDYDNDGFDDVYLSAYRGGALLHNEHGRTFKDVTLQSGIQAQPWGTSCSFGDVDGDGKLDLYIGNYVQFGPDTVPQMCTGFGVRIGCHPRFYKPEFGVLYHNEGHGKFRDITHASGADQVHGKTLGVTIADYDGTGRQSIALANDEVPGDLLENAGKKFKSVGLASGMALDQGGTHAGMGIDWGDFDNDGKLDLIVTTFADQAKVIYHNESGVFVNRFGPTSTPYVAWGVKWIDFDNDGWLDLMVSNGHVFDNIVEWDRALAAGTGGKMAPSSPAAISYRQPTQLLKNLEGKGFRNYSDRAGESLRKPIVGRGLAIGDFDNDGRMDALVVDNEGAPLLLHNESNPVGHWLLCKLVGTKCNRDGIGALVTAEAGGRKLLRRCAADGSYLSSSDLRVHFGLGIATVATLHVRWPNGHTDTYPSVAADAIVILKEGTARITTTGK